MSKSRDAFAPRRDAVEYFDFVQRVARRTGLDFDSAEGVAVATLRTLADRLSPQEARQLLAQLPGELRGSVPVTRGVNPLDPQAFVCQVAETEHADRETAREHVQAVFTVVRETVSESEMAEVFEALGQEWTDLLGWRAKPHLG
ncbi:hypothetical protein TH66_09505 [Carbonactinospora thermoautotrophica]|uniref:DUF2267 domain-containing protein n=1 Tax=Carbonactinospora thermoautotrophica TaxID=1469144 RepID=A0A132N951_9ACTN|nr:DUF2267 domain-containing protein [Carbonactinospora thermoautotrophica]KWX04133.1 hypothetical protein TH66_09505 [Carbonactinospora thermoautotrophica]KWX06633.1 hypothetical protein TR74_21410 [Carbonactinospora thermoautotrophica]